MGGCAGGVPPDPGGPVTFTGFPRPYGTRDPAVLLLYQQGTERQTGLTSDALTLDHAPVDGTLQLFKNGTLLDPVSGYTRVGAAVTLDVAAIGADVFQAFYHYRGSGNG